MAQNERQLRTKQKQKLVLQALKKTLGVVTPACEMAEISRETYYQWYNNDPEFKKQVDEMPDIALDFAEHALHRQIQAGNVASTIFFLKTKGRERGYVERVEHSGVEEQPVIVKIMDGL